MSTRRSGRDDRGVTTTRRRPCKACPWKKSTVPERDITGGYSTDLHGRLTCTIADPGTMTASFRMMACHETPPGEEQACAGWVANQLGPGNNLALRLRAMTDRSIGDFQLDGPQHERFEDTLPKSKPARRSCSRG